MPLANDSFPLFTFQETTKNILLFYNHLETQVKYCFYPSNFLVNTSKNFYVKFITNIFILKTFHETDVYIYRTLSIHLSIYRSSTFDSTIIEYTNLIIHEYGKFGYMFLLMIDQNLILAITNFDKIVVRQDGTLKLNR